MSLVLVTGGCGFVGSHVVDALLAEGHGVRVLDSFHPAAHSAPAAISPDAELVVGDVADPETVERSLTGVDAVSHQAAMVGLGTDFLDVVDYVQANGLGTAVLLRGLASRHFSGPLVLASSMVVYGEGRYRCPVHGSVRPAPRDEEQLVRGRWEPACPRCDDSLEPERVPEEAPVDPRSVYAATKAHQEQLCAAYARETGASVTVLRYHNVYGPRMPRDTPYAGVAAIFRSSLERGEAPQVFEDGGQLRDFVHVRDVARANVLALETCPGGTFNVASSHPRTVLELAFELGRAFPRAVQPAITGRYRLGDVRHVFAATDRADRELGFRAEIPFDQGVREFATAPLR